MGNSEILNCPDGRHKTLTLLRGAPRSSVSHVSIYILVNEHRFVNKRRCGVLLSCPAKKVTKERGQRGAEAGCSRTRAAPFGIPRRALGIFRRNLTGKICYLVAVLRVADCSTTSALPIFFCNYTSGKKSEHFLSEQDRG